MLAAWLLLCWRQPGWDLLVCRAKLSKCIFESRLRERGPKHVWFWSNGSEAKLKYSFFKFRKAGQILSWIKFLNNYIRIVTAIKLYVVMLNLSLKNMFDLSSAEHGTRCFVNISHYWNINLKVKVNNSQMMTNVLTEHRITFNDIWQLIMIRDVVNNLCWNSEICNSFPVSIEIEMNKNLCGWWWCWWLKRTRTK